GTGDMILAYTDGATEAGVADGNLLGSQGLLDLVQQLDPTRPERLLQSLIISLRDLNTAPFDDDVSLLLACADGSQATWWNTLLAPFRLLGKVADRSRFR